jgi:exodeoxyribonuclease V gamma subunit
LLKRLPQYRQRHRAGTAIDRLPVDLSQLHSETHDLLATWGRQGRDYLHLLDEFDDTTQRGLAMARTEAFISPLPAKSLPTRLQHIQHALFDLQSPPALPVPVPEDDSLRLVSCHTPLRELEVLHDQLLAWLDADDNLQPQDIMVMVPDMESFAAVIHAAFGRHRDSARYIPYSVADASPRRLPLLQAVEQLLHLPESRLTLSDWLGLFEVAAVRARFALTEADVALLRSALEDAVVRWGRDAPQRRAQLGLPTDIADLQQNTWDWGLRRLLLAYASDARDPWQDVQPAGALSGLDAQRLGAVALWLDAIDTWRAALAGPYTPEQWVPVITGLLAAFFTPEDEADKRLLGRLEDALAIWVEQCSQAGFTDALSLTVVREHLLAQVEDSARQARFFGGGVQFGTLMPMRSIPFRVVCVLGMNDADYPRRSSVRDFDLMGSSFRPGDRSRREDDRYLFLEALLSARDKLYISWQGNRVTDNVAMPPSVVVSQLIEDIALRITPPVKAQTQPLQPFSLAYFTEPATGQPRFVTYDSDWAQHQQSVRHSEQTAAPVLHTVTPPPEALTADALRRLLRAPVEVYWRDRLGVHLDEPAQALAEDEPFALDSLESYAVRDRLVAALLQNPDADVLRPERLQGLFPLAAQGDQLAQQLHEEASTLHKKVVELQQSYPLLQPVSGSVSLGESRLAYSYADLRTNTQGDTLQLCVRAGKLFDKEGKKLRLDALYRYWLDHVLLCAAGHRTRTVVVALDASIAWSALPADEAQALLERWQQCWYDAWQAPAPAARRTACEWLKAARKNGPDDDEDAGYDKASEAWEGGFKFRGEYTTSAYLKLSFNTYDDVAQQLPHWADALYGALFAACLSEAEE